MFEYTLWFCRELKSVALLLGLIFENLHVRQGTLLHRCYITHFLLSFVDVNSRFAPSFTIFTICCSICVPFPTLLHLRGAISVIAALVRRHFRRRCSPLNSSSVSTLSHFHRRWLTREVSSLFLLFLIC